MKLRTFIPLFTWAALLLAVIFPLSCSKWDLEKETFLEVTTKGVVSKTFTSLTIEGEILGLAANARIDEHGIVWSYTNPEPTIADERKEEGSRNQNGIFQSELTGLAVNTPLYVRAFARSGASLTYGEAVQVQPESLPGLSITMDSIRTDNASKVTLYGRIQGLASGLTFPAHGFVWSTESQAPTIETDDAVFLGPVNNDDLLMQNELPEPEALETYYVRAFAISGDQALYSSNVLSFTKGNVWRYNGIFPLSSTSLLRPDFQFTIDNQFYVKLAEEFGIYDPATNSWAPRNSGYPSGRSPGSFTIGQDGYIGAGTLALSGKCWKYNSVADTWAPIADFPNSYSQSIGFNINGKAYMGLTTNPGGYIDKNIYRYEPLGDQWTLANDFQGTTIDPGYVRFHFEDHITVGMAFFNPSVSFWSYYPDTDTWAQSADFPILLSVFEDMYTFTIGDKGYLVLPDKSENFWEYNATNDTWRQRADFPGGTRVAGLAFSLNGKGYHGLGFRLLNGQNDFGVWEYIPDPN
jgi:hypothetical protein